MAKKSTGRKRVAALWPGDFTAVHAIVALSLMLNVSLVAVLIALAQTNIFDNQIAARGAEILCSNEYLDQAKTVDSRVLLSYSCATDEAKPYFVDGYNKYRESLDLDSVR